MHATDFLRPVRRAQSRRPSARLAALLAAGLTVAAPASGVVPATPAHSEFVIRNVRIFDGARVTPRGTVWVRDGVIAGVGPDLEVPASARVVDGTGATVLPGLIDAHTHAFGTALRDALAFGVTTELDMFTSIEWARNIEANQAAGRDRDSADLRTAGTLVTAPHGHGTEYGMEIPTLSPGDDAQAFVDARVAEGSDYIKIVCDDGATYGLHFPTLDPPTMAAVIIAAHRRGKLAVVHVGTLAGARAAIEAGCDGLAHLFVDRAPDAQFATFAAAHHVFVVPTLSVLASVAGASAGRTLAEDPRLAGALTPATVANLRAAFPKPAGGYENAVATVRLLAALHVPILAGTDAPNPGTAHGVSLHGELELLVAAGLSPEQALTAATAAPADAFGLKDRGRILRGKRADLLLVNGDPTTDITSTRDILGVWKAGTEFNRLAYQAAIAEEAASATAQAAGGPPAGSESGLVSDFESGTPATAFGLGWTPSTDSFRGGSSTVSLQVEDGGASGSAKALRIEGEIVPAPVTWAGAMFFPGTAPMSPVDLSQRRAITFWTRGDGGSYQLMVYAKTSGYMPKMRPFTAGAEWTRVRVPFSDFETDGHDIMGLFFGASGSTGKFVLSIDDVRVE
jgi:imidazolonepropionase-like amidohydrolase